MKCSALISSVLMASFLVACGPSADELYHEANTHFAENQYKQAIPLYEKLYLKDASNANVMAKLAISYFEVQDYAQSLVMAKKALKNKMELYDLYYRMAKSNEALKQFDAAESAYLEGFTKFPDRYEMLKELGILQYSLKQYQKSVDTFKVYAKSFPQDRFVLYNIGTAYERLENWPEAKLWYQKILVIEPHHAYANFGLGTVFEQENDFENALKYYKGTLLRSPEHLSALYNTARLTAKLKKTDKEQVHAWQSYIKLAKAQKGQEKYVKTAQEHLSRLGINADEKP